MGKGLYLAFASGRKGSPAHLIWRPDFPAVYIHRGEINRRIIDPFDNTIFQPTLIDRGQRYAPVFIRQLLGVIELDNDMLASLDGWTRRAYLKSRRRVLAAKREMERMNKSR